MRPAKDSKVCKPLIITGFLLFALGFTVAAVKSPSFTVKHARPLTSFNLISQADYSFPGCRKENLAVPSADGFLQNNKFGMYVYDSEALIVKAAEVVNSQGGDWGYVLIPMNVSDDADEKWFKLFWGLSELHLIPIVQLWDLKLDGDMDEQIDNNAEFLNNLPWATNTRYVSVYNEVNDPAFWGGRANPEQYARVLARTADKLHSLDNRFYVMNGAFNASARNGGGYIDEEQFLIRMNREVPGIFNKLDGWASHPYPQPGFRGKPTDRGRDSIRAYEWELLLLKHHFGIEGLSIFITETGWPHAEGTEYNNSYWNQNIAAAYYGYTFTNVWLPDPRIVAIIPFTIYYDPPHDHFSFIKKDFIGYASFGVLRNLRKTPGLPNLSLEYWGHVNQLSPCF